MNFSTRNNNAFISQMLVWSLVLIGFAGSVGVAIVWQRQLIAQTANRIKQLEAAIVEVERHQTEITSELAAEQTFEALDRRNTGFRLGLAALREQQIVRVNIDPARRLQAKRNEDIYVITPPPAPAPAPALGAVVAAPISLAGMTR